jgi:hypothetical protein
MSYTTTYQVLLSIAINRGAPDWANFGNWPNLPQNVGILGTIIIFQKSISAFSSGLPPLKSHCPLTTNHQPLNNEYKTPTFLQKTTGHPTPLAGLQTAPRLSGLLQHIDIKIEGTQNVSFSRQNRTFCGDTAEPRRWPPDNPHDFLLYSHLSLPYFMLFVFVIIAGYGSK